MPVVASIVATDEVALFHEPPVVASLNVVVAPAHNAAIPEIAAMG